MIGSKPDRLTDVEPAARHPGRRLRRIAKSTLAICAAAVLLLAVGFACFVWRLSPEEVVFNGKADGIVVLTGGASRINDAIELLAAERGRRLLISGANRSTNSDEILRLNPEYASAVRCCVDFDRSVNTLGNAIETRIWAEKQKFRSLIVVTSNYHMPRALAEISHQLPGVTLLPYPVVSDRARSESWWRNATITRLLVSEYLKYIFAHVRMLLYPTASVPPR